MKWGKKDWKVYFYELPRSSFNDNSARENLASDLKVQHVNGYEILAREKEKSKRFSFYKGNKVQKKGLLLRRRVRRNAVLDCVLLVIHSH